MLFEKYFHWFFFFAACLFSFFPEVATLRRLSVVSSVIFISAYVCKMQSRAVDRDKISAIDVIVLAIQNSLIWTNIC